jgi:hypothetical protein
MFFSSIASRIFPGAVVTALKLPDLDDLNAAVRMSFTLAVPNQGTQAGPYLVFTTPGQGGRLDLLLPSLLSGASAPERQYPLELPATVESRIRETVKLPPGTSVRSLPTALEVKDGGAALTRTCVATAAGLVYSEDFSASALYYSGASYQGLRRLLEQRSRLRDGKVILVQGGAK